MPLRAWIRRDLKELVDDTLPNGEIVSRGYLSRRHIETLISEDRAGRQDFCREIFKLLTLELWFAHHSRVTQQQQSAAAG
jgi:hypothetical protein